MIDPTYVSELRVRYAETDKAGIVYYANYLVYMEAARSEMLIAHGLPYSVIEARGIQLPVREVYCKYNAPAFFEDILQVKVKIAKFTAVTCKIIYEIVRKDTQELLAEGFTVHPFIGDDNKLVRAPNFFKDIFIEEAKERG